MRIAMTGMGGELGTRVASLLESDPRIDAILGLDCDPPRRRLQRAKFAICDPRDRDAVVRAITDFEPTAMLHLGVYEPNARASARAAIERTRQGARYALGAAAECPTVDRFIIRSGIEVYGRSTSHVARPDESREPRPTSRFGEVLAEVEQISRNAAATRGASLTILRFAPIVGPHFPSPLGRYLRLPVVPIPPMAELPFALIHQEDAAAAIVRAVTVAPDAAVNVAAPGAVTPYQAVRLGGGVPVPVVGPAWVVARAISAFLGSPVPDHVVELLRRGRVADGSAVSDLLDWQPTRSTIEVVTELFEWASVVYLRDGEEVAA
ncbi:MAG: NAD-dependent epimerase/dehydratase family protein [Acidimicrobiales bacterium]